MSSPPTHEPCIERVEQHQHADAIEAISAADAGMREDLGEPRRGRDALFAHERVARTHASAVRSPCMRTVPVSGDRVAIRRVFELDAPDRRTSWIEEVARRRCEGERIVAQTCFRDPARMRAATRR